ncbi:MAG: DUF2911 domain-containing protein [Thermoanaerobaculia bacterium]|nr:DUF2911 domain-containing protein [Thermoanaerobaculia bacterium]
MKTRITRLTTLTLALTALGLLSLAEVATAQDLHPSRRPSPMGMARTLLDDGTYVRVVYSRPYERGRDNIFGTEESGALVPFQQVWRTGANEATEITVTQDVKVAGKKLSAGTYSMFTTPAPDKWKIHFNSALGLSGTARYNPETEEYEEGYLEENNVLTVGIEPETLDEDEKVTQFTISFEDDDAGADMVLRWIRTEVRVPIQPAE